jgi:hypothetical protein
MIIGIHEYIAILMKFRKIMGISRVCMGKSKAGYGKIRFCGEQTRRDGLQYFWVDTYYIDKSNSTELAVDVETIRDLQYSE